MAVAFKSHRTMARDEGWSPVPDCDGLIVFTGEAAGVCEIAVCDRCGRTYGIGVRAPEPVRSEFARADDGAPF